MATSFKEMAWPIQALVFLALAIVLVLAGLYMPFSPVQAERVAVDDANARLKPLDANVQSLRVYQQRRVELQGEMTALQKQLETLQAIVPENKEVDQFIIMVQTAASASGVMIRKIETQPVVSQQYHYAMPFKLTVDGPYFALLDFFTRLGRLSRIINVGDMKLSQVSQNGGASTQFRTTPGTTVTAQFTITTFFTNSTDGTASGSGSAAGGKAPSAPMAGNH
ncbi:MAG TPA: type 4a pilus biogenesis protein PilO [Candidatus Acidoferrales bacterium]|nr:type 4a pilus biogenesis protein PilO [Candidatus Acidoferrales bacterium]